MCQLPRISLLALAPLTSWADQKPSLCLADYNERAKDSGLYVGYGSGTTDAEASSHARADLARQIQVRVKTDSQIRETGLENTQVLSSHEVASYAAESLDGAKNVKLCQSGSLHEVVIQLPRVTLRKTVEEEIASMDKTAKQLTADLPKASPEVRFGLEKQARALREKWNPSRLRLCRVLGGCLQTGEAPAALFSWLDQHPNPTCFQMVWSEKPPSSLQHRLSDLLREQKICIAPDAPSGTVTITCRDIRFPPVPGTKQHVAEVSCTATGKVGSTEVFEHRFARRVNDPDVEVALEAARNQLELVTP